MKITSIMRAMRVSDRSGIARLARGSLQSLLPALALAVVAASAAGAVTLVNLTTTVEASSEDPLEESAPPTTAEDTPDPAPGGTADADEPVDTEELDGPEEALPLTFEQAVAKYGPPDHAAILTRRYPGAQWSLDGNDPSRLTWFGPGSAPTRAELEAHWPAVAAELDAERSAQAARDAAAAAKRAAELEARRNDPTVNALLDGFDPRVIWGTTPDYSHVLSRRYPGAQWSLNGNDPVNGLSWTGPGPRPTKAELDALWAEVAREMALEMDPKELARWAGTADQIYVDGVLRPKGWVGGANDPQPEGSVNASVAYQYLPHIPNSNNGSPVGSMNILKDPTGGQNFEQKYGIDLTDLAAMIAEAHGYFGGSYGLGLGLNGDRELMWYSDQVDPRIVEEVLAGLGALPPSAPDPEPDAEADPEPSVEEGTGAQED